MHNFQESWNKLRTHVPQTRLSKRAQLALDELQARPQSKLSGWLADVLENAPAEAGDAYVDTWLPQRYALIEASARIWIDSIFAELQKFAREFNNSSTAEQLTLVIERPKATFAMPCRRDPSSEPYRFICYQGHLAAHNWALLIRTFYECLQVFVLPSHLLLSLENNSLIEDVKPLAEFRPAVNDQQVYWALSGVTLGEETIPAITRELFADFIRLALGTITVSDLLSPATQKSRNIRHTSEQEDLSGVLKDLQLWQTRDLFSRTLCRDIDSLAKLSLQSDLDLSSHMQIESLRSHYVELQDCWTDLISTLRDVVASCQSSQNEKSSETAPSTTASRQSLKT